MARELWAAQRRRPPPLSLSADLYRIYYSAPLDENGTAVTTDTGDVPRGWQVSVGQFTNASQDFKLFVLCSGTADAVIAAVQPSSLPADGAVTATCPAGTRAVGGGMGKVNDTAIPADTPGPIIYESSPVDSTGTVSGTQDGDIATGWRTVTVSSVYGNRFFAICSAGSDALVGSASYTLPAVDSGAGGTSVACPAGRRAVSGGQAVIGAPSSFDRLALMGPFSTPAELASVSSGAIARSWSAYGRSDESQTRTYRVFVLCVSDPPAAPPPADTTPPNVRLEKRPAKETFSTKARFTFSSEAGAVFTCKLDKKPAKTCTSPFKVRRLKVGKHKVRITATDAAGNVDPTPAAYAWKVRKKPAS